MKRLLCQKLPEPGQTVVLPNLEAEHAIRVLRLREDDELEVLDGRGKSVIVKLKIKGGPARIEYLKLSRHTESIPPITIELSVLKGDAMEWVVEKCVELGVKRFIPLITDHTVVQMKSKGPEAFQIRWQKIADQSLKQCGRLESMKVELPVSLEHQLGLKPCSQNQPRIWCDEFEKNSSIPLGQWLNTHPILEAHLLLGPEGGWSQNERTLLERSSGITRTSLGPWVLRAETAALFGVSLLSSYFRLKT